MKLTPGKFYRDRNNMVWCCYSLDLDRPDHYQAYCVRVCDGRLESFYADGRYDTEGKREHTLVEEAEK